MFHVGLLEPNVPNTFEDHHMDPPPLIVINNQPKYKVLRILDSCRDRRVSGGVCYLVEWLGYENTSEANSWEPFASLEHAKELLFKFHHQHPHKLCCRQYCLHMTYFWKAFGQPSGSLYMDTCPHSLLWNFLTFSSQCHFWDLWLFACRKRGCQKNWKLSKIYILSQFLYTHTRFYTSSQFDPFSCFLPHSHVLDEVPHQESPTCTRPALCWPGLQLGGTLWNCPPPLWPPTPSPEPSPCPSLPTFTLCISRLNLAIHPQGMAHTWALSSQQPPLPLNHLPHSACVPPQLAHHSPPYFSL